MGTREQDRGERVHKLRDAIPRATGGSRSGVHRRRRKRGKARVALLVALSVVILATAGGGWLYLQLNGSINTFDTDGLSRERPEAGDGGQNVLVIGSDARTDGNEKLGGGSKDDIGRSDTAFVLHVHQDSDRAVAVSFPRDTLVDIPPCKLPDGTWTKTQRNAAFNAAFSVGQTPKGNPACTQNTVEKLTGLRMDHTVVVDFKGFSTMTEAVGGVPVCVPKDLYQGDLDPNRDTRGKRLFRKGQQTVAGQRALDYVRIRHGIGDGSDIGRIKRQQAFVGSLIKKIKAQGFRPTTLLPLANAATESMTVDEGLGTPKKMVDFAMGLGDIDLDDTQFVTVPWRYQGNRVALVQPDANNLWRDLRADRTLGETEEAEEAGKDDTKGKAVSGKGVRVAVRNGTPTPGLAATVADDLRTRDFTVTGSANADSADHTTTTIAYGPGQSDNARTLARLFPEATVRPTDDGGLTLTLGDDYEPPTSANDRGGGGKKRDEGRSAADNPCDDLSYG